MQSQTIDILLRLLDYSQKSPVVFNLDGVSHEQISRVISQARLHGVAPLLYQRIKRFSIPIPKDVAVSLRQAYLANVARNLRLYHVLESLLQLFARQQIAIIVLKGVYLAETIYENIGLREMADIDLLAKRDDLQHIDELLRSTGYQPVDHNRVIGRDNRCFDYIDPINGVLVEVHWSLAISRLPFDIDVDNLWLRAHDTIISNNYALALDADDLILHMCLHTAQHASMMSLYMLCDIGEIVQNKDIRINWDTVVNRSHQWGIERAVYTILKLSNELHNVTVPIETLQSILPDRYESRWYEIAKQQITSERDITDLGITPQAVRLWRVHGLWSKLSLLSTSLFLPRDEMSRMYPARADSWRIYPYYLVRFFDMAKRHLSTLRKLASADNQMQDAAASVARKAELQDWLMSR